MDRARPARSLAIALLAVASACDGGRSAAGSAGPATSGPGAAASAPSGADTGADATSSVAASASGAVSAVPSASASASPARGACPDDMVQVEGGYCPDVEQICKRHHPEYERDQKKRGRKKAGAAEGERSTVSERCLEYASPSRCLSKARRPMRFCIDRYEFPNKKGELPALLVSWTSAKKQCEALGKRLCTVDEFNFACEGEEMLPYTNGYVRDPQKCSIDKEYRKREKKLYPYEKCMSRPDCKAHLEKLDQRLPAGSMPECVSPFGVYDMNGNINEWVEIPGKEYPDRSGLKGGWWGPVRNRCRPTVDFHHEDDYGYEEGFRCCADAR